MIRNFFLILFKWYHNRLSSIRCSVVSLNCAGKRSKSNTNLSPSRTPSTSFVSVFNNGSIDWVDFVISFAGDLLLVTLPATEILAVQATTLAATMIKIINFMLELCTYNRFTLNLLHSDLNSSTIYTQIMFQWSEKCRSPRHAKINIVGHRNCFATSI